jgi:O-antigen/teichoic acid export membrane protein
VIARLRGSEMVRHGAIVFGGFVVFNVLNYLFYMLIGRRAGVVVYGEVTSLASALLVLAAPAIVLQLIVARLAADLHAAGDTAALRRLSDVVTVWTLGAGVAVLALSVLARDPIARFFNLAEGAPVIASGAALAAFLTTYAQRGVLQGAHLFEAFSVSLVVEVVAKLGLGVALVGPFGPAGALSGYAIGLALSALYNLFALRRNFGAGRASIAFDRTTIVRIITGVGLGQLTLTVLTFYDMPLAKHVFDARSAGLYAAATVVGRAVIGACAFVPTIVLPKATARVAAGRSPLPLLVAAVAISAAVGGIAVLICALAPRFVVTTIAGGAFGDAAPLVLPYVVASGALSVASVVAAYNFGLHRYDFVVPAFAAAVAEIAVLVLWHPTPAAMIGVLAVGHSCILLATLYGVTGRAPHDAAADADPEPLTAAEPIG